MRMKSRKLSSLSVVAILKRSNMLIILYYYRYVVSAGMGGFLYSFIQLPFAMYYAFTGKKVIKGRFLGMLDFYADKVCFFNLF